MYLHTRRQPDLQGGQRDLVTDTQTCRVRSRPASRIGCVKQTIAEQNEVSRPNSFSAKLLQLSLLDEITARSDQFKIVSQSRLELEHFSELVLKKDTGH